MSLTAFVVLLLLATHPFREGLAVDFFLRLDPTIGLATSIAARTIQVGLLLGLVTLLLSFVLGRVFCGYICPMGTTLDILDSIVKPSKRASRKSNHSAEAGEKYRTWKYVGLAFVLAGAVGGVSLAFLGSPLSLVTRLYGLAIHPVILLLAEAGFELAAPAINVSGVSQLAYVEVGHRVFATNAFVVAFFAVITALGLVQSRFWCRNLCPTGALLALCSRSPVMHRQVNDSCSECRRCIRECPTAAIPDDPRKTVHSECIVCLRCTEVCPESAVSFVSAARDPEAALPNYDPSRRSVLVAVGSGLAYAGLLRTGIHQPVPRGEERTLKDAGLIRPPGALPEKDFLVKCVRCGECMKACPTNTLQPIWLKAGLEGIFTPEMLPRLAACAVTCNTCGKVCPTGAIRDLPLVEKSYAKVGTAWIVRENCLVWEQDKKCLVCDEVCPYNAVTFRPIPDRKNAVPFVSANKCTGCGWCESKCPVEGASAIRVNIIGEVRLASGSYVEKAREYGLVFKARETRRDRLAPGTFDAPPVPVKERPLKDSSGELDSGLPPGFTPK